MGRVSEKTESAAKEFFDNGPQEESANKKYQYRKNGRAYIEYFREVRDGSSLDLSASGLPLSLAPPGMIP